MMDYSVLSGIYGTGVTLLQIIGEKWGGGSQNQVS